jgi:predicted AlkP superfamily phosphohydrolase/phosphomutase
VLAILQFDSRALPLVERMLVEGRLPVLARLRERGGWETIDARATVLQSSTYPTLCTGIDVREHGLYSAFPWSADDQRVRYLHAWPRPRTIWERLTERGRSSLIVDPYLAWAPREMAGVYLNGWAFEDRMVTAGRSTPRRARKTLARRHGRAPRLDDVYGRPQGTSLRALREHLVAAPGRAADAAIELLGTRSFDLLWLNFSAAHKGGHHLFDPASVVQEPLSGDEARVLGAGLADVYAAVDAALGHVVDALPDDADLIVFAPTGMGPTKTRTDLLPAMLAAVLSGKPRPQRADARLSRAPLWSLRSRVPPGLRSQLARALPDRLVADVAARLSVRADWRRVRAFAVPGEEKGYVRLNLRGREREGIVDPGEAGELLEQIADGLLSFRDADGSPSIASVTPISELAAGAPAIARLPDLVIAWGEQPGGLTAVRSPRFGEIERHGIGTGRSGHHADDAWAIILPENSRRRALSRAIRITDVGATACALLDADTDGLSGEPLLEAA